MSYWDAVRRFSGDIGKYADDEITAPELALRLAGEGGKQVGDAIGLYADAVTPDFLKEWVAQEVKGPAEALGNMGKKLGSAAYDASSQGVRDLMTSERLQRNVGSGFNSLNLVGMGLMGSPGQWAKMANNMPNELPLFYKGLPQWESARAVAHGLKNRADELVNPRSQAMLREDNMPAMTQNVVRQANEDALSLKNQRDALGEQLKAEHGADWKKANVSGKGTPYNELDKKYKQRAKVGFGQIGQNKLINDQYGITSDIINDAASDFTLSSGKFSKERIRELFPELDPKAADAIYRTISQTQGSNRFPLLPQGKLNPKVPLTSGILNERKMVGGAAGDILGTARKQAVVKQSLMDQIKQVKPKNNPYYFKDIENVFSNRPLSEPITSYDDLLSSMTAKKNMSSSLQAYFNKPGVEAGMQKVFADPQVKNIKTQEDFLNLLNKHGVPGSKARHAEIARRAFGNKPTKAFKNNDELIAALEEQGVPIYNKARVKEGEPVIVADSFKSGAMDLGGQGRIHAVFPDGRQYVIAHDKNDLLDATPYGAEPGLTVSAWSQDLTKAGSPMHKENRPPTPKLNPEQYNQTNFVNPATNNQKRILQGIMNYEPNVKMIDRLRALRNAGFIGSLMMEDEYEK